MKYTVEVDLWNLSGTILWWENEERRNIVLTENGKLIVFADPDIAKENYPVLVNGGITLREFVIENISQSENISVLQASEILNVANMLDDIACNMGLKSPVKGSEDLLDVLTTYEEGDLGDGGQFLLAELVEQLNGFMLDMKKFCTVVI